MIWSGAVPACHAWGAPRLGKPGGAYDLGHPTVDLAVAERIDRGAEPGEVNGLSTGTAYYAPVKAGRSDGTSRLCA